MQEGEQNITRLLEQARLAAPGALDRLLDYYRNYLRLLARTGIDISLQGKADPSDLVQETLLKAHRHFAEFRGASEAEVAVWLRQILARSLADLARRFRRESRQVTRERSLEEVLDKSSAVLGGLLTAGGNSP